MVDRPFSVAPTLGANSWPFRQWPRGDIKQHGQIQREAIESASSVAIDMVGQS